MYRLAVIHVPTEKLLYERRALLHHYQLSAMVVDGTHHLAWQGVLRYLEYRVLVRLVPQHLGQIVARNARGYNAHTALLAELQGAILRVIRGLLHRGLHGQQPLVVLTGYGGQQHELAQILG